MVTLARKFQGGDPGGVRKWQKIATKTNIVLTKLLRLGQPWLKGSGILNILF